MHDTLRRIRPVLAALAAMVLLAVPATASAKGAHHHGARDRNHDGLPDKWEKKNGLSTQRHGVAKADPDKDGLDNRAEFLSHTKPKDADSDNDGIGDADEDPDGDGVDNGNEARERTNPRKADSNHNGVKDGREDADHDKLNNAGEDQASTDPINPDTDGDGIEDGDEEAGRIVSFDGTTLTISLFGGSTISGTVDENTYIDCGTGGDDSVDDSGDDSVDDPALLRRSGRAARDRDAAAGSDENLGDDPGADDGSGDDLGADDNGDGADGGDTGNDGCAPDVLVAGAVVSEASFEVSSDGTYFDSIELGD